MYDITLALAITLAIELIIYNFLKPWDLKLFIVVILLNVVLNLTMNFLLNNITNSGNYYYFLVAFEVSTTIIESFVIYLFIRPKLWKAFSFAVLANLGSYIIGVITNSLVVDKNGAVIGSIIFFSIAAILFLYVIFRVFYRFYNNKYDKSHNSTKDH